MNSEQSQHLLSTKEAATILAISERTVWQLTHDGQLPAIRFGRLVRYDPADVRDFISRRRCGGNTLNDQ